METKDRVIEFAENTRHLYLGCELMIVANGEVVSFDEIRKQDWMIWTTDQKYCNDRGCSAHGFVHDEVKLVLRHLPNMTDEEAIECAKMDGKMSKNDKDSGRFKVIRGDDKIVVDWGGFGGGYEKKVLFYTKENFQYGFNTLQTIYLLSKHFDLFGLIESGLAIDKTSISYEKENMGRQA